MPRWELASKGRRHCSLGDRDEVGGREAFRDAWNRQRTFNLERNWKEKL